MARTVIVLGLVITFGLLGFSALWVGFGANNYLFQDGSTPLTGDWNVGTFDITIPSTNKLFFRDSDLYLYSSSDGTLDVVGDTFVNVTANGNTVSFHQYGLLIPNTAGFEIDFVGAGTANIKVAEELVLYSGGVPALTLDNSQDATFAGSITVPGGDYVYFRSANEFIRSQAAGFLHLKAGSQVYLQSGNNFYISASGGSQWPFQMAGTTLTYIGVIKMESNNFLKFRDDEIYLASLDDGHLDVEADVSIDLNAPVFIDGNLNMDHNYIIEMDFNHWLDFSVEGGITDEVLNLVPSGVLTQDRHYHRLTLGTSGSPGDGKFFNMTLTDGTNELTLSLTGAETSGWSITNEFDLDVSAETLTLKYSQTAGGGVTNAFVTIKYHYKENA